MSRAHRQLVAVVIPVLVSILATAQAGNNSQDTLAIIVQKMELAQTAGRDNVRPYTVTRDYRFFQGEEKPQPDSEVTAEISYYPPDTKQFEIRDSRGSGRGERVVRKVLEHETEMASNPQNNALNEHNYKFSLLGEETLDSRRCFVLGLEPRRESKELLKGRVWVDAKDYRILQIVGEPAKNPSWWIKRLQVTLQFANVEGMWLQTVSHAEADVRMFGHHVLSAHDVSYRTGAVSAAKRTVRRPQRDIGAGILIVR